MKDSKSQKISQKNYFLVDAQAIEQALRKQNKWFRTTNTLNTREEEILNKKKILPNKLNFKCSKRCLVQLSSSLLLLQNTKVKMELGQPVMISKRMQRNLTPMWRLNKWMRKKVIQMMNCFLLSQKELLNSKPKQFPLKEAFTSKVESLKKELQISKLS